ncbi:endogenous retrovirus group K member 24 Gag polyprotein-like [Nyctibius grandis]|uniref:endogenous retrovirus group K member 24 Gag polyprotein-like n=1 Tax=Nyctibius grandis TaxID=48427 RepID=UPI0035BC4B55
MGNTLSKEEEAVVKLLQHILSTRGLKYDLTTLKALLLWAKERALIPTVSAAFDAATWENMGAKLWDEITLGSKDTGKIPTVWRVVTETLKSMKAERLAASSAFAALTPENQTESKSKDATSATALLFLGPTFPSAPTKVVAGGQALLQDHQEKPGSSQPMAPPLPPQKEEEEDFPPPPPELEKVLSRSASLTPRPYPPLSPSTPPTPCTKAGVSGLGDSQLQELLHKLESLKAKTEAPRPPDTGSRNPFLPDSSQPEQQQRPPMTVVPGMGAVGGGDVDTGLCGSGSPVDPRRRWRGVIIEGQFQTINPMAFSVVIDQNGDNMWEALDWKMIKEAKTALTQYGLKSPYAQSILQHIFSAHLLTPYDTKMLITALLTPSQQIQFFQHWHSACKAAAVIPSQHNDPLFGIRAEVLIGTGDYASTVVQLQLPAAALQLSQDLAFRALSSIHDEKAAPAFTNVKQGPTEPYGKFIDRLHDAIQLHPDLNDDMKVRFLDLLAFDNANEKAKKALSLLSRGSSTATLIEAAERMLAQDNATVMAAAVGAAVRSSLQQTQ